MVKHRNVIIRKEDGSGVEIVSLPEGEVHSRQVGVAPDGFKPGDEEFIKLHSQGYLLFDIPGKWAKDAEKKRLAQQPESVLDRLKKGYLK